MHIYIYIYPWEIHSALAKRDVYEHEKNNVEMRAIAGDEEGRPVFVL